MVKQPPLLLPLDRTKRASLQTQLSLQLKRLVLSGTLRPGKAVPSSRELANDLQISRNTVIQAYDRLIGEGYLEASARRGLFVSGLLQEKNLRRTGPDDTPSSMPIYFRQNVSERLSAPVPFRPCQPDVHLFPLRLWNSARTQALRRHGASLLDYQSQHPLFLLSHLLLKPGDCVAMEDPGYLGARLAWQHVRAVIHPVPVDSAGMKLESKKDFSPKLIYTTPSRQFPIGSCLSLPRRLELLDFARRKKAWIVEDDYDSEFRYSRAPLPSLQGLDSSERVIYVGSTSKALFPSLRIGFAVLPLPIMEKFGDLKSAADEYGPLIDQGTLAEFIESGTFYRHIRRSRQEYSLRLEMLLDSAAKFDLPVSFPHADGGMNLAGFLNGAGDDSAFSRKLQKKGLEIPALSRYSLRGKSLGLLFGFTAFEPHIIRKSIQLACQVLHC